MQLIELDIPMVLALNMMDELTNNGGVINVMSSANINVLNCRSEKNSIFRTKLFDNPLLIMLNVSLIPLCLFCLMLM